MNEQNNATYNAGAHNKIPITGERLNELIDMHKFYIHHAENYDDDILAEYTDSLMCLEELKILRAQNKELIEDSERLFVLVEDYGKYGYVLGTDDVRDQHNALMEKYNG